MDVRFNGKKLLTLLGMICALLGSSCTKFVTEKKFIDSIGAANLKAYATDMQGNEVWNALKDDPAPKSIWLPSFATNGVLQVEPYMDGVLLVLEIAGRMERGVYVLAEKAETPEDGSGINFARIQSRIYWFEQKARAPRRRALNIETPASR